MVPSSDETGAQARLAVKAFAASKCIRPEGGEVENAMRAAVSSNEGGSLTGSGRAATQL